MDNKVEWAQALADTRPEAQELINWWINQSDKEARSVAPKAFEYGQTSLVNLGRQYFQLAGWPTDNVPDADFMEAAIWSYVNGKVQRWNDAMVRGLPVSDDTLIDISCYVKMLQHIREKGTWVGGLPKPKVVDQPVDTTAEKPTQVDPLDGFSNLTQAIANSVHIDWEKLDGRKAKCVHPEIGMLTYSLHRNRNVSEESPAGWYNNARGVTNQWVHTLKRAWLGVNDWSIWIEGEVPIAGVEDAPTEANQADEADEADETRLDGRQGPSVPGLSMADLVCLTDIMRNNPTALDYPKLESKTAWCYHQPTGKQHQVTLKPVSDWPTNALNKPFAWADSGSLVPTAMRGKGGWDIWVSKRDIPLKLTPDN